MADHQQLQHSRTVLDKQRQADTSSQVPTPFLDHTQQSLLVAALNSQKPLDHNLTVDDTMNTFDDQFTPDLLDLDDSFDFDNADLGGQMIGGLPYGANDDEGSPEQHEKRKAEDDDEAEEGDAKRQETTEKGAKKPGRKPLTNEPTTVCPCHTLLAHHC